jgi:photoactive yellow protein
MEAERLWRLVDVPYDQLDALPFGAVVTDAAGTIVAYNDYEQRLAQRERAQVLGRNFFRDVAPCTAVKAFEGRFREFFYSKDKERVSESFAYFFPFAHGAVDVQITFIRLVHEKRVLIAIERVDKAMS